MNINYKLVGGIVGGVFTAVGGTIAVKKYLARREEAKKAAAAKATAEVEAKKAAEVKAATEAEAKKAAELSDAAAKAQRHALEMENLRLQTETQRKALEMLNQFAAVAETAMGELQSELARKASRREAAAPTAEAPKSKAARPTKKTAEVVAPPVVRREATSVTA